MVNQNKMFSFKIKRQAKYVFPRDVERTVDRCASEKLKTEWQTAQILTSFLIWIYNVFIEAIAVVDGAEII